MKHCSSCGADSPEQSKFCIRCGKPLAQPAHPGVSNKNAPKKPFFSFRVRLIMASCIFLAALISGLSAMTKANPFYTPSEAPFASPLATSAQPSPSSASGAALIESSPSKEPAAYTYHLDDVHMIEEGSVTVGRNFRYVVSGTISITSDTPLNSAYLCVKIYDGDEYITEGAQNVFIQGNKIEFSVPVYFSSSTAPSRANYVRVFLSNVE